MEAFSKAELLRLLGAARAARERDWLMILVAYWHGLRASEVIALTRDSFADGVLTVQRLKGSMKTSQELFTHPEPLLNEREPLLDYVSKFNRNQRVFKVGRQRLWTLVQRYCELAGIPAHKRHPHVLKALDCHANHSFGGN